MSPVPYPFDYEESPTGFPSLLCQVWLHLYPQGEDPTFQVYCEKLADFVHEYRAEVFLFSSSTFGSMSRSAMGGPASTPEQAVLYAALEALVELRHHEIGMQLHPGLSFYPALSPTGQILFPPDSECDRTTVHLARYMVAQYELVISLAEELARSREALASISSIHSPPPPPPTYTPVPAPPIPPAPTPTTPGAQIAGRRETPEEWAALTATLAAPMLSQHTPPSPEGEPPRQRRRLDIPTRSMIRVASSDSEDGSDGPADCLCLLPHD